MPGRSAAGVLVLGGVVVVGVLQVPLALVVVLVVILVLLLRCGLARQHLVGSMVHGISFLCGAIGEAHPVFRSRLLCVAPASVFHHNGAVARTRPSRNSPQMS